MAPEYGARTSVPNTCSRRVFRSSNIRAKNGHSTGSYTGSTRPRSDWTETPVEAPMSAAFALDPLALPERTAAPTRPRLQLVPTGPDVVGRPVRISRRGRVARTVGALLVASALAWTGVAALAAGVAVPQHTVTVDAGQTLSSI